MRLPHSLAVPLLTGVVACAEPPPPPPPAAVEPDPGIAAADEVLRPVWYKGTSWTLEIQGKVLFDDWVPFWTRADYRVESVDKTFARVGVYLHPFLRGPSVRPRPPAPAVDNDVGRRRKPLPDPSDPFLRWKREGDGRCVADLELWLPLRLVGGELLEFGETRDARRAMRTPISYGSPPRTGTSPCIPLVPRHPTYQATSVIVLETPQSIEVTDEAVYFTLYEAVHTRITWLKGHPWWALMERVGSSVTTSPVLDDRRLDRLEVRRARLIAIDGGAIEPLPWTDETWLSDTWPGGGLDESELPTFDEDVPYDRWTWWPK